MKKHRMTIVALLLAVFTAIGFSTSAMAGPGWGCGRGAGYGPEMGYGYRMGPGAGGPGMGFKGPRGDGYCNTGYRSNLSDEQVKLLEEKRNAFFDATNTLRQEIRSKRLALKSEMAKSEPDAATAAKLQQEFAKLKAELGQKRIEHLIEMKKIDPNIGMGFAGRRGGRGYDRFGGGAGRPCWQ